MSGIIVIDIDGDDGLATLQSLVARHGTYPEAASSKQRAAGTCISPCRQRARQFHVAPATASMCAAMAAMSSRHPHVMPAVTSINGASMLAKAPLWLQQWARSRKDGAVGQRRGIVAGFSLTVVRNSNATAEPDALASVTILHG